MASQQVHRKQEVTTDNQTTSCKHTIIVICKPHIKFDEYVTIMNNFGAHLNVVVTSNKIERESKNYW